MKERFKVLMCSGIILFACSYIYDIPSALNKYLTTNGSKFNVSKVTHLYSAYALPNIVFPFIIGHYVQERSPRLSYYLCLLIFIGQALFSLGLGMQNYFLMVAGRLIYGLGGESFIFIQSKRLTTYFRQKELAFSMACFVIFGKLGTIANFMLTPFIAEKISAVMAAVMATLFSLIAIVTCLIIDARTPFEKKNVEGAGEPVAMAQTDAGAAQPAASSDTEPNGVQGVYQKLDKSGHADLFREGNTIFVRPNVLGTNTFQITFGMFLVLTLLLSAVWTPFYNIAPMLFQEKYNVDNTRSGKMISLIEVVALPFTCLTCVFSDFLGYKLLLAFFGGVFLVLSQVLIYTHTGSILLVIFLLGLGGPFISCYWPCIPMLVPEEKLGTYFSILTCVSNFSYTFSPMLVSFILSLHNSFDHAVLFFIVGSSLATCLVVALSVYDRTHSLGMNDPGKQRAAINNMIVK